MLYIYRHVIKHYEQLTWPTRSFLQRRLVQGRIIHLHFPLHTSILTGKFTLTILQGEHVQIINETTI